MDKKVYDDIERFEAETGIKFRTAHRQVKGKYHHTVVLADLFQNYSEKASQSPKSQGNIEEHND